MKLGTITAIFPTKENKFNIDFEAIKESGFEYVDYSEFADANNNIYKLSEEEFEKYIFQIKEQFEKFGLTVNQLHMAWPTDDSTPMSIQESTALYKRALKGASMLNCKYAVLHQRCPFGWNSDGNKPEEMYKINKDFILSLLPTAKEYGVTICLENLPWKPSIFPIEKVIEFVKDINDENLGICYDTGHANMLPCDPYAQVLAMGNLLKVMHCHDNNTEIDAHNMPRFGTFNWEAYMKGLKEIGFDGVISLEAVVPLSLSKDVLKKQRRILYEIIRDIALLKD